MKTFEKWRIDEVLDTFGLRRVPEQQFAPLASWLKARHPATGAEQAQIEEMRAELALNAEYWNEDELKFMFIGPFLRAVNLKSNYYKIFTQRPISAVINGQKINGIVDFVLAKGEAAPKQPYFFIHEYKQEQKGAGDPVAQLLVEMLAAQVQNEATMPVYGGYVMGRFWFFVALLGQEYAVSNAYNASDDDVWAILGILREAKRLIEARLAPGPAN
jgi:hypothetical protein